MVKETNAEWVRDITERLKRYRVSRPALQAIRPIANEKVVISFVKGFERSPASLCLGGRDEILKSRWNITFTPELLDQGDEPPIQRFTSD